MGEGIKAKGKEAIWGKKEKPYSLSRQLSRMITLCCVIAISIQSLEEMVLTIKRNLGLRTFFAG